VVSIIIIGIGQWEEYTKPLVDSIKEHEPISQVIVVDNGSNYPEQYKNVDDWARSDNIVSYASAINLARDLVNKKSDWIIVINNDVICNAPFVDVLNTMDDNVVYANTLHPKKHPRFYPPAPWIDGWLYAIPSKPFWDIGDWDEEFEIASWEDADYTYRAIDLGYSVQESNIPFTHLEYHIRREFENYDDYWLKNLNYMIKKHGLKVK
jgi:GT2 family glycosyltransferase